MMEKEELQKAVDAWPYWYHQVPLPHGIVTPGWAPLNPDAYRLPRSLTGKRVLDIGAWDGYWGFECLKRGAREVVAIDDFSDIEPRLPLSMFPRWGTFDLCRDALGYADERCQRFERSVYDLGPDMGRFDIVLMFGVLYHCRYPLLALDKIASVCDGQIWIETAVLDDYSPYRGGYGHGYPDHQVVMEFYPGDQYGANHTNWWAPTIECLYHMTKSAGFPHRQGWKLNSVSKHISECRGFMWGSKTDEKGPE